MRLRKNYAPLGKPKLFEILELIEPSARANIKRKGDIALKRLLIKAKNCKHVHRLYWAAGLGFMLDGVCLAIKL
jgi:hypothetical protein